MAKRIYLVARFGRQAEMRRVAAWLQAQRYRCDPAWLHETQLPLDVAPDDSRGATFALDAVRDLKRGSIVICFTEKPGAVIRRGRGGRHVEMGMALALGKRVIVVGYRENVFCWLPQVEFHATWAELQVEFASPATRQREALAVRQSEVLTARQSEVLTARQSEVLTARQSEVLAVFMGIANRNGIPPTVRELMVVLGLSSTSTAQKLLFRIMRKGYLDYAPGSSHAFRPPRPAAPNEGSAPSESRPPDSAMLNR